MNNGTAPTVTALGPRPLPWIVAKNVEEGTALRKELDSLGATVKYVDSLLEVRQADYSIVVAVGEPDHRESLGRHMKVLQFAETTSGIQSIYEDAYYGGPLFCIEDGSHAARFTVGRAARALGLEALINQEVLRNVPAGGAYNVIRPPAAANDSFESLVHETDGYALAGIIKNPAGSQWWMLAAVTTSQHLWLRAALAHWREEYPDEHPPEGQGLGERWQTATELSSAAAITAFEAETERQLQEREHAKLALIEHAEAAAQDAEKNERRLLTAQGDELVSAVTAALERIGFTVVDSDAIAEANNTAKREDLRISLPAEPSWIALAEVKGYSKGGAKSGDLRQLAKAVGFFTSKTDRAPDAQWYIVNAQFAKSPDERPIPLAANAEDVDDFAGDAGAVIDTRQIFLLLKSVVSGAMTEAMAQQSLTKARGIYTAPVEDA